MTAPATTAATAPATGTAPAARRPRAGWGRARLWLVVVAALVVVALVAGPGGRRGSPLDPRSTTGDGAKALVLLLEHFGATVELTSGAPGPTTDVAVVLTDALDDARRGAVRDWVRAGGHLVVADPTSPLQASDPARDGNGMVTAAQVSGPCPDAGLDGVDRVDTGGSELLDAVPGAVSCLAPAHGGGVFVVQIEVGAGRVTGLGGAGALTNARLAHEDNSVLAVELLAPGPGTHVAILLASPAGSGGRSLWSLIDPPVKIGLVQLLVAFAALVLWQVVRFGRPVDEEPEVRIPGSEIVAAVGDLLARTGNRDAAADALRASTCRMLGSRLGLGPRAAAQQVAAAAEARFGIAQARVLDALVPRPLGEDADLVRLAQALEQLRQEVAHARR